MGYYFLLKKLEYLTEKFYTMVIEKNQVEVEEENRKMLDAADEVRETMEEMKEVFNEERAGYEESLKAYEENKANGYYDKGFGIIEGWFLRKIYIGINLLRYDEYFKILERVERKLNQTTIKLRFILTVH